MQMYHKHNCIAKFRFLTVKMKFLIYLEDIYLAGLGPHVFKCLVLILSLYTKQYTT